MIRQTLQRVSMFVANRAFDFPKDIIARQFDCLPLTPELIISAYSMGMFPIGYGDQGKVAWQCPDSRAVIPIEELHVSKRLKGYLHKDLFKISFNTAFEEVLEGCGDREESWINEPIAKVFRQLFDMGFAQSVEAWQQDTLVAGGYGLSLGRVFFLESMYSRVDHASKIAFVKLGEKLKQDGYRIIDTQELSEHWRRFGARPMPRDELIKEIVSGLQSPARFNQQADRAALAS